MTRPIRSLVAALARAGSSLAGVAACGIDEDELAAGRDHHDRARRRRPDRRRAPSPAGPAISLPDIPSDVTEPDVDGARSGRRRTRRCPRR